ncbi:MAG: hypothetical protein AB1Z16_09110 [Desulfotignum sp.]
MDRRSFLKQVTLWSADRAAGSLSDVKIMDTLVACVRCGARACRRPGGSPVCGQGPIVLFQLNGIRI